MFKNLIVVPGKFYLFFQPLVEVFIKEIVTCSAISTIEFPIYR